MIIHMSTQRHVRTLNAADSTVQISDYGAQILDWVPSIGTPILWRSPLSDPQTATAVRGGIPLCLPWFGRPAFSSIPLADDAPAHGTARTQNWDLIDSSDFSTHHRLVSPRSKHFPHFFTADLHTTLSTDLIVTLLMTNNDNHAWSFEQALHTYFRVGDLKDVSVLGLNGASFREAGQSPRLDSFPEITFVSPTDRIYTSQGNITIEDPRLQRRINIDCDDTSSVIIWTPWACGVASMSDVPSDQWDQFLCVEVGNVWDNAVKLQPGDTHVISMRISVDPMS